jgi:hypothetical protein
LGKFHYRTAKSVLIFNKIWSRKQDLFFVPKCRYPRAMRKLNKFYFIVWFVGLSALVVYLMKFHMVSFPDRPIQMSSLKLESSSDQKVSIHHFLSTSCGCSKKILNYLVTRKKSNLFNENVYLIENRDGWKEKLEGSGFTVAIVSEQQAEKEFGVQSVPLLVLSQQERKIYQGGYNEQQMHQTDYHDLEIAAQALESKKDIKKYPLFGCANGQVAKKNADPFGVKYE